MDESKQPKNLVVRKYKEARADLEQAMRDPTNKAHVAKISKFLTSIDERIKALSKSSLTTALDKNLANMILNDVLVEKPDVKWEDVAGLEQAKKALQEIVILPSLRPDLYTGLRAPAKGLLLFGPPGTGKTMLAKAVAHEAKARFFALSASSLVSKYFGESEKIVRTVFALARELEPSILFIDEVDAILSQRSQQEHDASRRLKTEFLVQFDGVASGGNVVVLAATNRPQELDEAARRRFPQRIYVGLPDQETRSVLVDHLLSKVNNKLSKKERRTLVQWTDGYSCSDMTALAKEAALYPLRDFTPEQLQVVRSEQVRPLLLADFKQAMTRIRASVSPAEVQQVEEWGRQYGASGK